MYVFILVVWVSVTGGAAYVITENGCLPSGEFTSEKACTEAASKQKVTKFKCNKVQK